MNPPSARRIVGVTIPLFSLRTERSWGIGEIGDLGPFGEWIRSAGVRLVQILPLNEIAGNETSPYSSLSAFGIDPMFVSPALVPELAGESLADADRADLDVARAAARVDYGRVRRVKAIALRHAYARFLEFERGRATERAHAFEAFCVRARDWLDDYATFRALKDACGGKAWWQWPQGLRDRHADAMADATRRVADAVGYYKYVQWLAHSQWHDARERLHAMGVQIMGDLPFMVGRDSADVWAHRNEFRHDADVGAPADQFNEEGQDWGLPPYRWESMRKDGFLWLRRRARYAGELFDCFRVDHVVGFFRTFVRAKGGKPAPGRKLPPGVFDPADETQQGPHGEAVIGAMVAGARESESRLIAEDLGIIPDFVRPALTKLGVPGYKVLIWEKDGDVFRDPAKYPSLSVSCFGTHDTDSVVTWWEGLSSGERSALVKLPTLAKVAPPLPVKFDARVHAALLETILSASSEIALLQMQDVLGSRERVNTPATQGPANWTYRLPMTLEALRTDPSAAEALVRVRVAAEASNRA